VSATADRAGRYRARVAPRAAPRRSRIRWDRLGRIVLVLVLFAVLVSYVNPVVNLVDSWRDSRAERERLDDVRDQNRELRKRYETLKRDGRTGERSPPDLAATPTPAAATGVAVPSGTAPAADAPVSDPSAGVAPSTEATAPPQDTAGGEVAAPSPGAADPAAPGGVSAG
jgi:hypothetical protein